MMAHELSTILSPSLFKLSELHLLSILVLRLKQLLCFAACPPGQRQSGDMCFPCSVRLYNPLYGGFCRPCPCKIDPSKIMMAFSIVLSVG